MGCLKNNKGQSAVEVMFMAPIIILFVLGMYELFTITWASQNAHIRARDFALHGEYMGNVTHDSEYYTSEALESEENYKLAEELDDPTGHAEDTPIPGVVLYGQSSNRISVNAVILTPNQALP